MKQLPMWNNTVRDMLLKKIIRDIPELLMYYYKGIHFPSRYFQNLTRTYTYGLNFGYLIIVGRRISCFSQISTRQWIFPYT